jgi:NADP-dependent 3-hydroxy acid dehydrogenase YdfG
MDTEVIVLPTDVTDRRRCAPRSTPLHARIRSVDVVVNNAGILRPSPVLDIDPADLEAMLRVNLFGALYVMQEAAPGCSRRTTASS